LRWTAIVFQSYFRSVEIFGFKNFLFVNINVCLLDWFLTGFDVFFWLFESVWSGIFLAKSDVLLILVDFSELNK
jgi:type IV secretory pathway TrbD component